MAVSNQYYGFLAQLNPIHFPEPAAGNVEALFEIVPKEWVDLRLPKGTAFTGELPAPSPASMFHLSEVNESDLRQALGLSPNDLLVEGEWYVLQLAEDISSGLLGMFFDPDADLGIEVEEKEMQLKSGTKVTAA
jgi:hypothetical protein